MDWDNLRYFLELARTGTLAAAARRTGVEHTTVARRIQALEKQMGAPLFAREATGHRLTEAGRQLLPAVEAMEAAVLGIDSYSAFVFFACKSILLEHYLWNAVFADNWILADRLSGNVGSPELF